MFPMNLIAGWLKKAKGEMIMEENNVKLSAEQEKALASQRKAGRFCSIYNILFTVAAFAVGIYSFMIIR